MSAMGRDLLGALPALAVILIVAALAWIELTLAIRAMRADEARRAAAATDPMIGALLEPVPAGPETHHGPANHWGAPGRGEPHN